MNHIDFQALRDQWALKAPLPVKERIHMQMEMDRSANPHNDTGRGKKPRRSEAEIISDLAYAFADEVLAKQYPNHYHKWLIENCYELFWGTRVKISHPDD